MGFFGSNFRRLSSGERIWAKRDVCKPVTFSRAWRVQPYIINPIKIVRVLNRFSFWISNSSSEEWKFGAKNSTSFWFVWLFLSCDSTWKYIIAPPLSSAFKDDIRSVLRNLRPQCFWVSNEGMFKKYLQKFRDKLTFSFIINAIYPCQTIITSSENLDVIPNRRFSSSSIPKHNGRNGGLENFQFSPCTLLPKCNISTNSKQKWK